MLLRQRSKLNQRTPTSLFSLVGLSDLPGVRRRDHDTVALGRDVELRPLARKVSCRHRSAESALSVSRAAYLSEE